MLLKLLKYVLFLFPIIGLAANTQDLKHAFANQAAVFYPGTNYTSKSGEIAKPFVAKFDHTGATWVEYYRYDNKPTTAEIVLMRTKDPLTFRSRFKHAGINYRTYFVCKKEDASCRYVMFGQDKNNNITTVRDGTMQFKKRDLFRKLLNKN